MIGASARMPWQRVPPSLREAVERMLGSEVVSARTQSGGFSPGSADRVLLADGTRAFVKTASVAINSESVDIHRLEARKSERLPAQLPAPRLIGQVDHGEWVALVFEDVEGRYPRTPWRADELHAVLDALADVAETRLPDDGVFPSLDEDLARHFGGWARMEDASVPALDSSLAEWVRDRAPEFVDASAQAVEDVRGDRLVHMDARADNLLIRPDGAVVLVDWPWAARGTSWFDALSLMVNVRLYDSDYDIEGVIGAHRAFDGMPQAAAMRVLTALAGYFLEGSTQPAKPGLPTLRAFQRDQGIAALQMVRERR